LLTRRHGVEYLHRGAFHLSHRCGELPESPENGEARSSFLHGIRVILEKCDKIPFLSS
jgi:hypothetical protein